jgi:starch phosphorylase
LSQLHWPCATASIHRWLAADRVSLALGRKRIYYLSLEFLIGRLLNDVVGASHSELVARALGDLGVDYDRIRSVEPDAALGMGASAGSPHAL